jgi:hypothetical protein
MWTFQDQKGGASQRRVVWWGKRHFKINVSLVIAVLLFLLWKSFF